MFHVFFYFLFLVIIYVIYLFNFFSFFDFSYSYLPTMTSDEIELFRLPINRGNGAKLMPFLYGGHRFTSKGRADDVYKKGRGVYRCSDPLCRATFTVRRKQVGDEDVFFTYSLPMHNHDSRVYERKHEYDVINSIKKHTSERAGKGERLDPSDVAADCAAIIDGCGDMRGSLTKRS